MDVDPSSVGGEVELKAYMRVQKGVQRHRLSDVVEAAPARVSSLDPNGQAVPGHLLLRLLRDSSVVWDL
jgi:hypothetical protein